MATYPITWPRNARRINQSRRRETNRDLALSEALEAHRGERPLVRKSLERRRHLATDRIVFMLAYAPGEQWWERDPGLRPGWRV